MNALIINCSPVRNGATAEIVKIVAKSLSDRHDVTTLCIDDYTFSFCKGCRSCHTTAECVMHDGVDRIIEEMDRADVIVCVAPSYWADIPGQFKAFIDRCTPWCNTHEPHAVLRDGKRGFTVALRTGPSMRECDRVLDSIDHFYGHLEIERCGRLGLCSVENRDAAEDRRGEIEAFCEGM